MGPMLYFKATNSKLRNLDLVDEHFLRLVWHGWVKAADIFPPPLQSSSDEFCDTPLDESDDESDDESHTSTFQIPDTFIHPQDRAFFLHSKPAGWDFWAQEISVSSSFSSSSSDHETCTLPRSRVTF